MTCPRCSGRQGRGCAICEGTLDEPIPNYPLIGILLSVVIIAGCMLAIAAAVKGWL